MLFVILQRYRSRPTPESVERAGKYMAELLKQGMKVHGAYYTLGRYDAVFVVETPATLDEKMLVQKLLAIQDVVQTETMVAVNQSGVTLFADP